MQKRFFAISLFTTALLGVSWSQPKTKAAERPQPTSSAAKPVKSAPLPTATSKPVESGICLTKNSEPPHKREHSAKDPSVTLGQSFVIPKEVSGDLSHIPAVSYRLDGEKLFTVTNNGQLFVWSNSTQKIEQQIVLTDESIVSVVLDPRGCFAAWSTKSDFYLLALEEKNPTKIKGIAPKSIALSPANDVLALAFADRLELRSTSDASLQRELKGFKGEISNLSFSPDGKTLGVTTKEGAFSLLKTDSLKELKTIKKSSALYALAFSPDNKFVTYGGAERIVYQMELASYQEEVITQDRPYVITTLSYSPDGEMIAFGDESCDVWLFRRADKKNLFHSKHHNECWLNGVTWTPDSQAVIFGCRPNSGTGRSSIYVDNHLHEANNDSEVVRLDKEIEANNQALNALLSSEAMAPYRKKLEEAKTKQQQARKITLNHNEVTNTGNTLNNISNNYVPNNISNYNYILNNTSNNNFNNFNNNVQLEKQSNEETKKLLDELEKVPSLQANVVALRSLNEQRNSNFEAKVKLLNESFCVNQWVITH
jgi:WD40 repeat protein